ncbi:MAG: ATP-binding cassette domain-containing protein [Phycisphaeraceae bacterium]|nr:ATP-binding cassette domain-containing protein [Phycisphaeraceae bacterium]MCW5762159.1 ATP-binding cassette domain-containing protein [Phycisphaeraceae bacterium]
MSLLEVHDLHKLFPVRGGVLNRIQGHVHAVNGVTFNIEQGQVLGVVGESGCGKSTLGKTILRLYEPTQGRILLFGQEITTLGPADMMPFRRAMQIIFQDPYSSLNPKITIAGHLREAIRFHRIADAGSPTEDLIDDLMKKVGLRPEAKTKYPHEFSGGQRQRIGIARALCVKPRFIVADEPVSALDVSIQAQVLNLLADLKDEFGLTMMFISHDLKVIAHFCDRVLVMYLGHVVEELESEDLDAQAQHPYTKALLGANPIDDPDDRRPLTVLQGDVPSPFDPPPGCPFVSRCPIAVERCKRERPPLEIKSKGHRVACWEVE